MPVRVTQGMTQAQLMRNVSNNYKRMSVTENILSTSRKINKPSDDPVGITYALRYRSETAMNEQYQRNLDTAQSRLEHTDTVLGQVNDVIQRAKELTVRGLNGTNPQSALSSISGEIKQLYEEMVTLGNSQFQGKYIFNGQKTDITPYTSANAPAESSDGQLINFQFAAGVTVPVNITGNDVFGAGSEADNIFGVLKGLSDAFGTGDMTAAADWNTKLVGRFDKFLQSRSEIGARVNRLELVGNRLGDMEVNLDTLTGKVESADMAEAIMNFKLDESVYQASLSAGAKIIQPSLMDYLR